MTKKKLEPMCGIGKDPENKLVVQKSYALSGLWQSDLSLPEFKLLDAYLARIDSHKPERRQVTLSKGEIEQALGMKKINLNDLIKRLCKLGDGIKVPDSTKRSGFRIMWLLESANGYLDENGQWIVTLEANQKALNLFFGVEAPGYFRYKLRCIAGITSRYTYVLFQFLEQNRHMHLVWETPLVELKKGLGCFSETYNEYKRFNDLILKKCHKEINEKTECRFTYEPIKKGRTVTAIRFTLEKLSAELEALLQPKEDSLFDALPANTSMDVVRSSIAEFSDEEQNLIIQAVFNIPLEKLPEDTITGTNAQEFRFASYLDTAMARLKLAERRAEKNGKPIKNRFSYFMKLLQKDAESNE